METRSKLKVRMAVSHVRVLTRERTARWLAVEGALRALDRERALPHLGWSECRHCGLRENCYVGVRVAS